jgi:hypothetical protein
MDYARDYEEGVKAIQATFYEENLGVYVSFKGYEMEDRYGVCEKGKDQEWREKVVYHPKMGNLDSESLLVVTVGLGIEFYTRRFNFHW